VCSSDLIFEQLDFRATAPDQVRPLVAELLRQHRFEPRWTETLVTLVADVLATSLDGELSMRLNDIPNERRLNELEFFYPLTGVTTAGLRQIFRRNASAFSGHLLPALDRLHFSPARGFMKGYIDLIFENNGRYYLVDYKSNFLGPTADSYRRENLATVMAADNYFLQYHLYSVALHRYLTARLPDYDYERHFGGVFYLFVRAMRPAFGPGCGVLYDRPALRLIEELSHYLSE